MLNIIFLKDKISSLESNNTNIQLKYETANNLAGNIVDEIGNSLNNTLDISSKDLFNDSESLANRYIVNAVYNQTLNSVTLDVNSNEFGSKLFTGVYWIKIKTKEASFNCRYIPNSLDSLRQNCKPRPRLRNEHFDALVLIELWTRIRGREQVLQSIPLLLLRDDLIDGNTLLHILLLAVVFAVVVCLPIYYCSSSHEDSGEIDSQLSASFIVSGSPRQPNSPTDSCSSRSMVPSAAHLSNTFFPSKITPSMFPVPVKKIYKIPPILSPKSFNYSKSSPAVMKASSESSESS